MKSEHTCLQASIETTLPPDEALALAFFFAGDLDFLAGFDLVASAFLALPVEERVERVVFVFAMMNQYFLLDERKYVVTKLNRPPNYVTFPHAPAINFKERGDMRQQYGASINKDINQF